MASRKRADGALGPLDLKSKRGRPPGVTLRPEHAAVIRRAVKAMTRYYGIRIGDLDEWIATAMRSAAPLSVEVAVRLFYLVQLPPTRQTGKRPQGPSLAEVAPAVLRFSQDSDANPLPENAATDYLDAIFEAAAILNLYVAPFPGSAIFAIPGIASSLAKSLVESFVEDTTASEISNEGRRKLVLFLEHTFRTAERPFYTEYGRQLLPHLVRLGVANRRELIRVITEQFPEQAADNISSSIDALVDTQERRLTASQKKPEKATRKKRKVTMPRIKDVLR